MDSSPLNTKCEDNDEKTLNGLFEAFGSSFSLQDVTSAYYKADRNADLACEILNDMEGSISTSPAVASNGEARNTESSRSFSSHIYETSCLSSGKSRASKQKRRPVSGGTISSILGKDYVNSMPVANGASKGTKPIKLDAKELPMSEIWGDETKLNPSNSDRTHKDIEDFLFRMLGDGFQLERNEIQQALDTCGYDMQKSMEKLLAGSAVTLDEENKYLHNSTEKILDVHSNSEVPSCQMKVPPKSSYWSDANGISNINGREFPKQMERDDLQKGILTALFNPDKFEGLDRRAARKARRSAVFGDLVAEPLIDFTLERKADSVDSKLDSDKVAEDDEEDSYQQLRRAVQEYRVTMKEYYKAAVNAFSKGDFDRANKLMDQGHFFHEKARNADKESSQKIFEIKNVNTKDEATLDLHDHGPKEAVHLLKCHLSSLSGISSIKYLKIILETNEVDKLKGARRRWVMKLLEKESIKWTEGGNSGTILIRLDNINPKCLSFATR